MDTRHSNTTMSHREETFMKHHTNGTSIEVSIRRHPFVDGRPPSPGWKNLNLE
ncbi:hypothetical protein CR513_15313, partial [Mucuna pruriens]